jgi:hypothetical protein
LIIKSEIFLQNAARYSLDQIELFAVVTIETKSLGIPDKLKTSRPYLITVMSKSWKCFFIRTKKKRGSDSNARQDKPLYTL